MGAPRIACLLPAATEIVAALGLGDRIVGISHECDWPETVRDRPVLTSSSIDSSRPGAEIDAHVRERARQALTLYDVDMAALAAAAPTHIVTQDRCAACAVDLATVERVVAETTGLATEIISLSPARLGDVFADMRRVADELGGDPLAVDVLEARIGAVRGTLTGVAARRALAIEWCDPPMASGHWISDVVEAGGGEPVLAEPGGKARTLTADDIAAAEAEVAVFMPCGFDLDRASSETRKALTGPTWAGLDMPAVAVDANRYFTRPGPGLVDSIEIMAEILHPTVAKFGHEGRGWRSLTS